MKFSNFLFPESKTPQGDFEVIDESLREAVLSEELGYDVVWLAEHHFDGGCAYVDPTTFAAAIADEVEPEPVGPHLWIGAWITSATSGNITPPGASNRG